MPMMTWLSMHDVTLDVWQGTVLIVLVLCVLAVFAGWALARWFSKKK